MRNPYSIFLMAQLAVGHGEIDKDLEYDLMWAEAQILLDRFESSKYNTESKSEIDCITDYLNSFKKPEPEETKLESVADRILVVLNAFAIDYNYRQFDVNMALPMEKDKTMCDIIVGLLKLHLEIDDNGNLATE